MANASQVNAITSYVNPNASFQTQGFGGGAPTNANDAIMQQLQAQNSNISSSENDIQSQYTAAIQQLQSGGAANQIAIQNKYNPLIANQQIKNQQAAEGGLENNHGYGLNAALLQTINKQSDDDMQTLVQERDSALATGQAETAKSVSDLMVKALEDKANNTQAVFKNLLDMASYKQTADRNAADIANQQFTQQTTLTDLAAKYGVTVDPGETPQSLANKIAPIATKEERGKLDLQMAQIHEANANASRAIAEANVANAKVSDKNIDTIAEAVANAGGPDLPAGQQYMANLKDSTAQAQVSLAATKLMASRSAKTSLDNQVPLPTVLSQIMALVTNKTITSGEAAVYIDAANSAYASAPKNLTSPSTPPQGSGAGFTAPGTFGPGGLAAVQPWPAATEESKAALIKALQGTALRK